MGINHKQQAFIDEYMINGHNATKAYKKTYPSCNGGWDRLAARLMCNDVVKAEIKRRMAKTSKKLEITRESQLKDLERVKTKAEDTGKLQVVVRAIGEQNEMLGLRQDKAPNADKAQAVAKSMSEQDIAIAEEVARILTERAARSGDRPKLSKKHA